MLFVISLVILILLASSAIWLRNKWVLDTFSFYGISNSMAGIYLYKKFGLWHISTSQDELKQITKLGEEPGSIAARELDLKPGYAK